MNDKKQFFRIFEKEQTFIEPCVVYYFYWHTTYLDMKEPDSQCVKGIEDEHLKRNTNC